MPQMRPMTTVMNNFSKWIVFGNNKYCYTNNQNIFLFSENVYVIWLDYSVGVAFYVKLRQYHAKTLGRLTLLIPLIKSMKLRDLATTITSKIQVFCHLFEMGKFG